MMNVGVQTENQWDEILAILSDQRTSSSVDNSRYNVCKNTDITTGGWSNKMLILPIKMEILPSKYFWQVTVVEI